MTGCMQISRPDPGRRFFEGARGFTLGKTTAMAATEDYLTLGSRVGQQPNDTNSLLRWLRESRHPAAIGQR